MTVIRSERHEGHQGLEPMELVARDVAQLGKPEAAGGEPGVSSLKSVIQRVSGTSALEIEKLIAELQTLRDHLQTVGQRVQQEIAEYAQMSRSAMNSTKIIAENLSEWRRTVYR